MMVKRRFEGVFAALTTPFINDEVSTAKLKENIQKFNSFNLSGYVIAGSTGESVYLSDDETERLVEAAKEAAAPGKKIIVGAGKESTKLTLDFTNKIAELGIDAALILTPSYFKSRMSQEALKKHYLSVADHSRTPLIIYNNPMNAVVSVDSKLIIELSRHPNIVGIKDSSGNLSNLGEAAPHLPPDFNFIVGSGAVVLAGLTLGASGAILAMANAAPAHCARLYQLFLEKKLEEAAKLQVDLVPLNKALVHTYGIPAVKHALDLLGYYGGPTRLPLLPPAEEAKKEIASILSNLGLLKK